MNMALKHNVSTEGNDLSSVVTHFDAQPDGRLSERVYVAIRQAVLTGDLAPNTRLRESDLLTVIPVSRTPIREALLRLREEGLVRTGGNQVLEVRDLDLREALQNYQILEVLEPLATELATAMATEELINALRENVDLTEFFFERERWDDVTRESLKFHHMIYEASGNERLVRMISRLREETHRFRRFWTRDPSLIRQSLAEDRQIVDAIASRNPEVAKQTMRQHIGVSTERIKKMLDGNETHVDLP
jgi:DNA-binding GntR family transcriptional regulator